MSTLDSRLDSQGGSYEGPRRVYQLRVLSRLGFELPEHIGINKSSWSMPTGLSDYPSHPQVLPSFSTGSWTDPFSCVLIGATQTRRRECAITIAFDCVSEADNQELIYS